MKYIIVGISLGLVLAAILYIVTSGIITVSALVVTFLILISSYLFIKYRIKNHHNSKNIEEYLSNIIRSVFSQLDEGKIKIIVHFIIGLSAFSIFSFLSLLFMSISSSVIAIEQNRALKDQNYLICQQNQYLATNNKFFNPQNDSNQDLYNYFERIRSTILELRRTSKEWDYAPSIDSDILNDKYSRFLPSQEFTEIIDLQEQIITDEKNLGYNSRIDPKFRSLIVKYKNKLKSFYDKINIKEKEIKKEWEEKMLLYIKNSEINCEEYKQ